LQLKLPELRANNAEVLAVCVDPVEKNAEVVSDLGLQFHILSDPQLAVVDAYDLRHSGGYEDHDIARPATFIIDESGVVRWRNLTEDFRVRPRPEEILAAVQQ